MTDERPQKTWTGDRLGYASCASADDNDSAIVELQTNLLRDHGCTELFIDQGFEKESSALDRPGFMKLVSALQPGDSLVVCEMHRLSHSAEDQIAALRVVRLRHADVRCLANSEISVAWLSRMEAAAAALPPDAVAYLSESGGVHDEHVYYDTFDPAIVLLCKAINSFPGILTTASCQGYIDGHRKGLSWRVCFSPLPETVITPQGYCSIEFLTWVINSEAKNMGFDVTLRMESFPPDPSEIGRSLSFVVEGHNRHPDDLAELINRLRDERFLLPER